MYIRQYSIKVKENRSESNFPTGDLMGWVMGFVYIFALGEN